MTSRRLFLAAGAVTAAVASVSAATAAPAAAAVADFDRATFEARLRAPFRHRQAFASAQVADGAVLGFIFNSLNAYETGFGEGPNTLNAAAILYHNAVALGVDDLAWQNYQIADVIRRAGDRLTSTSPGNPFVRGPRGWSFGELQSRNTSFFVCQNALTDLAQRCGTTYDTLRARLLPGMMLVPAGVAAVNAIQEEHFTLFVASA